MASLCVVAPSSVLVCIGSGVFLYALQWGGVINTTIAVFLPLYIGVLTRGQNSMCGSIFAKHPLVCLFCLGWGLLVVFSECLTAFS